MGNGYLCWIFWNVSSLKNFKLMISALDATFVDVEPPSKIDDDSNKLPAAIPSSIGWLCQEKIWLFLHSKVTLTESVIHYIKR